MKRANCTTLLLVAGLMFAALPAMSSMTVNQIDWQQAMTQPAPKETSVIQMAIWSAGSDSGGPYIRNGRNPGDKIYFKTYKKAEKAAKKFNKLESKGVKADPDGLCDDPRSGVVC
ncbi:MAG: hypothetical protein GXP09_05700 [Gammaproteobacteria bacterium]|nr:hypothetical protein [Gammaproteobacteria bacterium]